MPSEHNSHFLPDNFFGRVANQITRTMRPSIYPIHWIPLLLAVVLQGFAHFNNKAKAANLVSSLEQQKQISWQIYLQNSQAQDHVPSEQLNKFENTEFPVEFHSGLVRESVTLTDFSLECISSRDLSPGFLASQTSPLCILNREPKQP